MNGAVLVVASGLVDTLQKKLIATPAAVANPNNENNKDSAAAAAGSAPFTVHGTLKGEALTGTLYQHPLYGRVSAVVVGGDYITTESGNTTITTLAIVTRPILLITTRLINTYALTLHPLIHPHALIHALVWCLLLLLTSIPPL